MPRKAVDSRIPALIRNGVQEKKRSFIVVVGDRAKDVIVHLHYIMSSVDIKQNKSVLWAYKKDLLGFTSNRKKREAKIKKEVKRGIREANTEDPFELFVTLHNIRYVYYKETEKILGNTYGMCILQDFEAITPNLLARTIETVEGGGLVLLLLKGMKSLKQLYTLSMDVHSRYRTEAHEDVVARFNERFILSLGSCESCLVVDDELNVLPISGGKNVQPLPPVSTQDDQDSPATKELKSIKNSLGDTQPVGSLVTLAKTVDQAKALLSFVDAISEKTLRSTVTLTAARGRGKSAALGVAIAAAVAHGYSNIFITSPSPENLKTLFEFVFKGFDALNYLDHVDYTILQSTNPEFNKAIVRVNVHRQHRQTIQYIQPQDAHVLGQAELLVIDEAAAIPLPLVRKLMGPYLVFLASTINGYEGTGRSLSLKLIQQLRDQSHSGKQTRDTETTDRSSGKAAKNGNKVYSRGRSLREITLSEPIRYAQGDAVEKWLNRLLCLDATLPKSRSNVQGCPHPSQCQLLHVNRDTLFSFHPVSEKFLQQMMTLYVASHYKNSPNDLQLMSDAPAHRLFVLVPPIDEDATRLPEPLCVVQVALEGRISRQSVLNSLSRGQRAGGDLIPWLVSQQFQDSEFAGLSGSRVVRIATNPDYLSMGYGTRALQLLIDFYEGRFTNLSENDNPTSIFDQATVTPINDLELQSASLLDDTVKIRDIETMPPLFSKLSETRPDPLDYVGVSYGLTSPLHKFWKRALFAPVYLRQTPNDLTGEHSCVMLRTLLNASDTSWLGAYSADFHKRFLTLLSYQFRTFPAIQSLSLSESAMAPTTNPSFAASSSSSSKPTPQLPPLSATALESAFSPFDLARLESYANNMLDYHVILDLLPQIAIFYFTGRLKNVVSLSGVQQAILLALGLQRKVLDEVEKELGIPGSQLLAMFVKVIRKTATCFRRIKEDKVAEDLPGEENRADHDLDVDGNEDNGIISRFEPVVESLADELAEGAGEVDRDLKEKQRALIDALPLDQPMYTIPHPQTHSTNTSNNPTNNPPNPLPSSSTSPWADAERQIRAQLTVGNGAGAGGAVGQSTVVSVKAGRSEKRKDIDADGDEGGGGDGGAERKGKGKEKRRDKDKGKREGKERGDGGELGGDARRKKKVKRSG